MGRGWSTKFGDNINYNGLHQEMMQNKNFETMGNYQAEVSGMYGEFTIASVLKSLPEEYVVLNDILIQTGTQVRKYGLKELNKYGETPWELARRNGKKVEKVNKSMAMQGIINRGEIYYELVKKSTQLDHVVVSPYGLYVIETKNHKGMIFGDSQSKVWTQVLTNGAHNTFYSPVLQNERHLQCLSNRIGLNRGYMTGMIVFTNPEADLSNICCECCFTLNELIYGMMSYKRLLWNEKQVEKIIEKIEDSNSSKHSLNKEHIMYVKDLQHRYEINKRLYRGR